MANEDSVVTKAIPSNSLAVDNSAKVIRRIKTGRYGMILDDQSLVQQGTNGA